MALHELLKRRVEKNLNEFCNRKVPKNLQHQIKLGHEIRGNSVTLFEERPQFQNPQEWVKKIVAQLRYDPDSGLWTVYWKRHTGKWYKYDELEPSVDFKALLEEINKDTLGIFWG